MRPLAIISVCMLFLSPVGVAQEQLTNLPTIYISTEGGQPVVEKEKWLKGSMKVVAAGASSVDYEGEIEIRGRGNSTWSAPKKPYRFRLPKGSNHQLLGLPSDARNWVLLANYFDNSLIRNALAFELSSFLNFSYTPPYRFVDVVFNGNYIGNYTLTDHIQVENKRVEVEELGPDDVDEQTITGGYFIQEELYARDEEGFFQTISGGALGHVHSYAVKYPDSEDINAQQRDYIVNYIQDYDNRLFSDDFLHPHLGYNAVTDRTSQVNWQIANELTANQDSYLSVYMTKRRNDPKLYFGPMWDLDRAFDNSDDRPNMAYRAVAETVDNTLKIKQMLKDPGFVEALKHRWKELRRKGIYETLTSKVAEMAQTIDASQQLNFQLPNIAPTPLSPSNYQDRIQLITRFLRKKIGFLDYHLTREIDPDRFYQVGDFAGRRVLTIDATSTLSLKTDEDFNKNQEWSFIPVGTDQPDYYYIKSRHSGLLLTPSGNDLIVAPEQSEQPYLQRWQIRNIPGQSYAAILTHPMAGQQRVLGRSGETGIALSDDIGNLENSSSRRWFFVASDVDERPLPVTLSDFTVSINENLVTLAWRTTAVKNFSHFEIQRTSNPLQNQHQTLESIYFDEQPNGIFQFIDRAPELGINFYRLKMVDLDGSYELTPYRSILYSGITEFKTFPNPADTELTISFTTSSKATSALATIYDLQGKSIRASQLAIQSGANTVQLTIGGIPAGLYILQLSIENQIEKKRFVIHR